MSHAIISPSGFKALRLCPGKPAAEAGRPDNTNEHSAEGTAAHELAAILLSNPDQQADAYVGRIFDVDGFKIEATEDFCEDVQTYVDAVRARITDYEDLFGATVYCYFEQQVPIGHITGEQDATGTADAVLVAHLPGGQVMLDVWDLKFGKGVEVSPENNDQLMLYALGAVEKLDLRDAVDVVRLMIHQPRLRKEPREWETRFHTLTEWWAKVASPAALKALSMFNGAVPAEFVPGESQCRFCKAKADCKALEHHINGQITGAFEDLTLEDTAAACEKVPNSDEERLGKLFSQLDLIDGYIRAVRARIEQVMLAGGSIPGVKLVQGKRGNRQWINDSDAEHMLKSFRLRHEEMYVRKLATPTQVEKALKDSPRRWARVEPLITRNEGKIGVAPADDPRPAIVIKPVVESFTDVSTEDLL